MLKIIFNIIVLLILFIFIILNVQYKTTVNFFGKIYNDINLINVILISITFGILFSILLNLVYKIEKSKSNKIKKLLQEKDKKLNSNYNNEYDIDLQKNKVIGNKEILKKKKFIN